MRYSTCPFRVTKIKNDNSKFYSPTPLLAMQNDTTTLEESQQLCIKLKFNSAFPFLDIYPREGKKKNHMSTQRLVQECQELRNSRQNWKAKTAHQLASG